MRLLIRRSSAISKTFEVFVESDGGKKKRRREERIVTSNAQCAGNGRFDGAPEMIATLQ